MCSAQPRRPYPPPTARRCTKKRCFMPALLPYNLVATRPTAPGHTILAGTPLPLLFPAPRGQCCEFKFILGLALVTLEVGRE